MPNHFHCIVQNKWTDPHICPDYDTCNEVGSEHIGSPLCRVIQWFKTMTTNEYIRGVKTLGWKPFDGKLWQRNYYEHIIRDEHSYQRISKYIINNPLNLKIDRI